MKPKWKNITLIILGVYALVITYFYFRPEPVNYDPGFVQARYDSLQLEFNDLATEVDQVRTDNKKKANRIDSLENLKPKLKYVYIEKSNYIDIADFNVIVNEFSGIFSKNHIR